MALVDESLPLDQREAELKYAYETGRNKPNNYNPLGTYSTKDKLSIGERDRIDANNEAATRNEAAIGLYGVTLEKDKPRVANEFDTRAGQLKAEEDPLKQRYEDTISRLRTNQTSSENSQLKATRGELAKRGITGSSTLAQQQEADAINPIRQQYTGLEKEIVADREYNLRSLANQITNVGIEKEKALAELTKAIAQVKISGTQQNAQLAMQAYQTYMQKKAQEAALAEDSRRFDIQQKNQKWQQDFESMKYDDQKAMQETLANARGAGSGVSYGAGTAQQLPTPTDYNNSRDSLGDVFNNNPAGYNTVDTNDVYEVPSNSGGGYLNSLRKYLGF